MEQQPSKNVFADFVRNIENAISNLTTLEIKTIIGDYTIDDKNLITNKTDGNFQVIQSTINLIGGDIVTNMSKELTDDKYEWLRTFHANKEEHGHEIIERNIKAIISLYNLYNRTKGVDFKTENMDETLEL